MVDRRLMLQTVLSLVVCAALVAICYAFVDRPVARWVHEHRLGEGHWLRQPTYIVPWLEAAAPWVVYAWRPWSRWQRVLLTMALNLLVAVALKEQLKWVFGRPWPETWIDNNPSYLGDGLYAFQWFRGGEIFGSFPSGHTTAICAAASIVWIAWPAWRWLVLTVVVLVVVGLVGDNYHFVGDTIAGATLGWLSGVWASRLASLRPSGEGARRILSLPESSSKPR
jgi:membrane-associated phospholipid phosphatase